MAEIPTREPQALTAGDTAKWSKCLPDYPAGDWTLSYALVNSAAKITFDATADGTDHLVTVPATTTAAWAAGLYQYQAYVTNGDGDRYTIGSGQIKIAANLNAATTLETRSTVKQTLDAIEAEILARATGGMTEEYTIAGRSLKKAAMTDLIVLRDKYAGLYQSELNAERVKQGLGAKNKILTRL